MTVAVIPVKSLSDAKQRLSTICSPIEREKLSLIMLESLLNAVLGCDAVNRCCVVTPDASVKARLRERYPGVSIIHETTGGGLNEAFVLAARRVEHDGANTMLFLHGDLPLASSNDIGEFAELAGRYAAVIVPDKHGTGTTSLALTPPGLIYPAFGEDSFARHLSILNDAKIAYAIFRNNGLGMDIDSQEDMRFYSINKPG